MSCETIERVTVNIGKFKQIRGGETQEEFARRAGISVQMLRLIEKGERWKPALERFAEFCERTGTEPNAFFEIVKKIS